MMNYINQELVRAAGFSKEISKKEEQQSTCMKFLSLFQVSFQNLFFQRTSANIDSTLNAAIDRNKNIYYVFPIYESLKIQQLSISYFYSKAVEINLCESKFVQKIKKKTKTCSGRSLLKHISLGYLSFMTSNEVLNS